MGFSESENLLHGEIESAAAAPPEQSSKTRLFSSMGRQSSIYSLTLDEFQHTLCESGKSFGSMNMDEFLTNIWNAEENQAVHSNNDTSQPNQGEPKGEKTVTTQPGLPRQGSLTLPALLCRKTVEEVWSEIHRDQQQQQQQNPNNVGNPGTTQHQPTFGEMTLEDFLIRAGVVRESCEAYQHQHQHQLQTPSKVSVVPPAMAQQQYGLYQKNNTMVNPNFGIGPVMGLGFSNQQITGNGVSGNGVPTFQTFPQSGGGGYPPAMCFGGRVGNGGLGSPISPVSSDGLGTHQVDNSATQYGSEMRGRKRIIDGPVEKVVERRQRRMIKNRESAARSRARKQAYTVELEAELNQFKEENARIKQTLAEADEERREQLQEEMKYEPPTKAQITTEKLKSFRRSLSLP
ncbi:hypothetical protein HHK36_016822 [Tetracentron sinense]|uniref:BZIP domain-containing protein n=1 Tax=Tetracentron sinense TaxID=13715 RepID=A0A834Z6K1_TETSI|nr:hypothetical protein HHK36_016822 [Tetracentron sinense]